MSLGEKKRPDLTTKSEPLNSKSPNWKPKSLPSKRRELLTESRRPRLKLTSSNTKPKELPTPML